jgi:hypothetical protein
MKMAMEKRDAKVTPVKTTTAKAAEAKEEAVAAANVKAEEPKKAAEKAAEEKKETVKKEATAKKAVKKSPAKKTETKKAEKVEEIYLQFHGQEIFTKEIMEKAKKAYIAEGHRESSIKSIRLYIKPEENMAYYVINEKVAGGVAL